jgi:hypothetical protein
VSPLPHLVGVALDGFGVQEQALVQLGGPANAVRVQGWCLLLSTVEEGGTS